MKNIFIRSGMSPFESFPAEKILIKNSIGTNVGNFLYVYGLLRNITMEDTVITPTYYKSDYTDAEIEKLNETQDIFLIPLADAFRSDFKKELHALTNMVKKLTIPCVVTSVGLRSTYEPDFSVPFDFDNDVKEFVSAVLEKSSIIGVRGEITGKYLSRLGFKEDTDYMVTGCPSMYTNGSSLPIRPLNLTKDSRICLNSSVTTPNNIHDFLYRTAQEIPDWHFVPQVRSELQILYSGIPYKVKANPHYPRKISDKAYCDERSKFFLNAPTWFDYLAEADLAIGSRLHGNIAALIAGTPALLFPKDARVRELADYHNLTSVPANQVTEDTSVWELVESVDFQSPCSVQKETFDRFISFLDKNEIPHIYSNDAEPSVIPFEERMKQVKLQPPVTTAALCSPEELAARWAAYNSIKDSTILRLREKNAALTRELNAQKAASGSTLSLFQKGIKYVRKHL